MTADRPSLRRDHRFPGLDVAGQASHWDAVTAGVVLSRLGPPPPLEFFTDTEQAIGTPLIDLLLDQPSPDTEGYIPLLALIDARLNKGSTDGWHYADMPEDGQAWRDSLRAIDDDALHRFGGSFATCDSEQQRALIGAVQELGDELWHNMQPGRVWSLWTRYVCTAFYADPRSNRARSPMRRRRRPGRRRPMSGSVKSRNESAWLIPNDGTRTNHSLRRDMRRFDDHDEVDMVVIGCGAGGATVTQRLARAGWRVVALDAGPFWDPDADWVSDEAGSHHLYWTEPRVIAGDDPVPLGSNNSGRGVGGSMIHYAGYTPRFHPSDFHTATVDGVGADWPLSYEDLRPHYADIEAGLPVAGEKWPWGDPHGYPHRPHPVGGNGEVFLRGARALGITAKVGPVAIPNGRFGNRPHCIYRGFCLQGCRAAR